MAVSLHLNFGLKAGFEFKGKVIIIVVFCEARSMRRKSGEKKNCPITHLLPTRRIFHGLRKNEKALKPVSFKAFSFGPSVEIRTQGLLNPILF